MMTSIIKGVRQCLLSLLALVLLGLGSSELLAQSRGDSTNTEMVEKRKSVKQGTKTTSLSTDSVKAKMSDTLSLDSLQARLSKAQSEIATLKLQVEGMQSEITEKAQKTIPWYQSLWLVMAHILITIVIGFIALLAKLGPKTEQHNSETCIEQAQEKQYKPAIEQNEQKLSAERAEFKEAIKRIERLEAELDKYKSVHGVKPAQEPSVYTEHRITPEPIPQPISTQIEYVDDISRKDVPIEVRPQRPSKCYFKIVDGQALHLIDELTDHHISTLLQDGNLNAGLYRVEGEGSLLREKEAGRVSKSGNSYKLEKPLVLVRYDK